MMQFMFTFRKTEGFLLAGVHAVVMTSNLKKEQESSLSDLHLRFLKVVREGLGPSPWDLAHCSNSEVFI